MLLQHPVGERLPCPFVLCVGAAGCSPGALQSRPCPLRTLPGLPGCPGQEPLGQEPDDFVFAWELLGSWIRCQAPVASPWPSPLGSCGPGLAAA